MEKYDYFELENKYKSLKNSFSIVVLLIAVNLFLISILMFSRTEIIIDQYDGTTYLYEKSYWGIVKTYKEIRYHEDKWMIKDNGKWEILQFYDDF